MCATVVLHASSFDHIMFDSMPIKNEFFSRCWKTSNCIACSPFVFKDVKATEANPGSFYIVILSVCSVTRMTYFRMYRISSFIL